MALIDQVDEHALLLFLALSHPSLSSRLTITLTLNNPPLSHLSILLPAPHPPPPPTAGLCAGKKKRGGGE